MATVVVTFGRTDNSGLPLEQAAGRTEELVAEGATESAVESAIEAGAHENVVTIYANADVWVSIGDPNNDALTLAVVNGAAGQNRRFIPSGAQRQFAVRPGDKVATIEV